MEIYTYKTLFVLGNFLPKKNAGIENYTFWWISNLGLNANAEILLINQNGQKEDYYFEGLKVVSIKGFDEFKKLDFRQYLFVHFMELSGKDGINSRYLDFAKLYTKVYFTFHLPYYVCIKGDLRYHDKSNCTGSSFIKCSGCILSSKMKYSSKANRFRTYFINKVELKKIISSSNKIFFYADWFYKFCLESNLDVKSFNKVPYLDSSEVTCSKKATNEPKRKIVYVGRIEEQKGLLLICKALEKIPNVEFDVYGNIIDKTYFEKCVGTVKFNYQGVVSREILMEKLPEYDALILPSMFSEMASMVVLQAILQEVPVIVSSALGNLELVNNYQKGLIFDYGSFESLTNCLNYFYKNFKDINNMKSSSLKTKETKLILAKEYGLTEFDKLEDSNIH